jgi:chromosome segregation ATPase
MKIKQIEYKKLFNLGDFKNETLGLVADLEEGEKPEKSMYALYLKIDLMHKKFKEISDLKEKLLSLEGNNDYFFDSIKDLAKQLENYAKGRLELETKLKGAESKDHQKQLKNNIKSYKKRIIETTKKLKDLNIQIKDIKEKLAKLEGEFR